MRRILENSSIKAAGFPPDEATMVKNRASMAGKALRALEILTVVSFAAAACTGNSVPPGRTPQGPVTTPTQVSPAPTSGRPVLPKLLPGTPYPIPASIDHSCGSDVTASLKAWLEKVPNGTPSNPSVARFVSRGCYRVATGLEVTARR